MYGTLTKLVLVVNRSTVSMVLVMLRVDKVVWSDLVQVANQLIVIDLLL